MASQEDVWPSAPILINDRVKHLITRFFDISDSLEPTTGDLMADEVFAKDGIFTTHKTLVFKGHDEIAACRSKNHPAITARGHQLVHVFAKNSPATDLVVLGNFDIGLKDGNNVVFDFTGRFVVAGEEGEERLQFVQIWTDPTEMLAAFNKAMETLAAQE